MRKTEERNPRTKYIDKMSTAEMLKIISDENKNAVMAVENELTNIGKAVDAITETFEKGGRLFYVGAGTSGRLGVIDAAECPPTFGVSRDQVVGIIAGGERCMVSAAEGEEDNAESGKNDLLAYNITDKDVVVGISASGGAAYIISALKTANEIGAVTVSVTCNQGSKMEAVADIGICTDTGAEVITGSTRMKAGTAQKLVLNMLSTCSMIKTGKVYENLMINLRPTNIKLRARMISVVSEILGTDSEDSEKLLEDNGFNIREAIEAYKEK